MNEWFRSWHGAPTDPKWRTVAKRASVAPSLVVAVAWALMDRASQDDDRGSILGLDCETLADFMGCEADDVERIIAAMREKCVLTDARFTAWEKRQPKRERDWQLIQQGRLPSSEWAKVRRRVFERDAFTCTYCGASDQPLHCDHIIPVSQGGSNADDNLTTACEFCNLSKSGRTPAQWGLA